MVFVLGVNLDQDLMALRRGVGFNPDIRAKAVRDLRQMKARNAANGIVTNGRPLGIHPAFYEAHRNSPRTRAFESEFEEFVRGLAKENAYFVTSIMYTEYPSAADRLESKERWVWQRANIVRTDPEPAERLKNWNSFLGEFRIRPSSEGASPDSEP